jgi:hypothetical protein
MILANPQEDSMKPLVLSACAVSMLLVLLFANLSGQTTTNPPTPNPGLIPTTVIPVPIWTPSGATSAAFDLFSFNPVTRLMYQADWRNHGALVIDTVTNTLQDIIKPSDCTGNNCPSGVLVIPDLQWLVLTSRQTTLWIYDLKNPSSQPLEINGLPNGQDELDYDPIHQRIYVANTTAPYFLTGIDLAGANTNNIVAMIPLPGAPEQPRFNPVDGMIYQTIPSTGVVVIDPNAGAAGTGDIVRTIAATDCGPQGNDVDPVTNIALLACTGGTTLKGAEVMNLASGQVLAFWPNTQVIDVLYFNRNTRRWYAGAGLSSYNGGNCPSTNTGTTFPVLGVFAAPALGTTDLPTFVGGQCSGRSGRVAAVDPIGNNVYVPTSQYPADPASATTGSTGILVFNDPTASQPTPARSQAVLGSNGTVTFTQQGRLMNVFARLQGLNDAATRLVITSTAGNESVVCNESAGQATCTGALVGDPLIGGVVLLGNSGKILSKGTITATPALIVTGLTFDMATVKSGSTFGATISGSNLTAQTFFDVRFRFPGSAADNVALNWQTGTSMTHSVAAGTTVGTWTINGVRAHADSADHTGGFAPVSTTLGVTP